MKSRPGLVVVRCAALGLFLAFLARESADCLTAAYPYYAQQIHDGIGLLLVICVGVFCLRPMFLAYPDKPGQDKKR